MVLDTGKTVRSKEELAMGRTKVAHPSTNVLAAATAKQVVVNDNALYEAEPNEKGRPVRVTHPSPKLELMVQLP